MHTWLDATTCLGCLHTCMPAQGSVTPFAVVHRRKRCFLPRQPRKALRNLTRISAVDEDQRTELNNKQAGARMCEQLQQQSQSVVDQQSTFLPTASDLLNCCSGAANHSKDAEKPRLKQSQPEGELQLLPNRRFVLAGLGSLTIGD